MNLYCMNIGDHDHQIIYGEEEDTQRGQQGNSVLDCYKWNTSAKPKSTLRQVEIKEQASEKLKCREQMFKGLKCFCYGEGPTKPF